MRRLLLPFFVFLLPFAFAPRAPAAEVANSIKLTQRNAANTKFDEITLNATANSVVGFNASNTIVTVPLTGTNTGDQNIFQNIVVANSTTVTANSTTGNLTFASANSNLTITTDNTTKTITFNATGGGGGGGSGNVTGPGSSTDNRIVTWNSTGGTSIKDGTNFTASGNSITSSGNITLNSGTNHNIVLAPAGTGIVSITGTANITGGLNVTGNITGNQITANNITITTFTVTDLNTTNLTVGGKTLTLAGNLAVSGASNLTLTTTGATNITLPTTGTVATVNGNLGTPSAINLSNGTSLPLTALVNSTSTAVGIGQINLGHASDTQVYRGGAGFVAINGETIATDSNTLTLTNKRITARITTITSSATPTINTDNCDFVSITALAAAITSMTTNLSGTPVNGDMLLFRIKDDGTARAITWGSSFEATGAALPTTTVISKRLTVLFIYDSVTSKWGCVSTAQES